MASGDSDSRIPIETPDSQPELIHNDLSGQACGHVIQAQNIGQVRIGSIPYEQTIPRELPPAPPQFVNRQRELTLLSKLVTNRLAEAHVALAVLNGIGGVGKTATALQWAYSHESSFTGGQFYADLAMYRHRSGVKVVDVLGDFLRALGVNEHYIPSELAARAAMFRSRTARAHVLVVLDNVDQAAEVRPLLPTSSGSVVLVTSRRRLGSLAIDGAELIDITPLDPDDSSALISAMLPDDDRPAKERGALRQLVGQCAGLPIALRIAGARLIQRRRWSIERLVGYLTDERKRLQRLSVEGQNSVASVFDVAYSSLPPAARKVYRCLGLHPGPDVGVPVVAAAARIDEGRADEILEELCEANLVEEFSRDRYRVHDLVRIHALHMAEKELKSATRERVIRDVVDYYLLGAAAADQAVLGTARWRLGHYDLKSWRIPFDAAAAMDWFIVERLNLIAAVRVAASSQWHDVVWQFCEALWAFYYSRKHHGDWIESHQLGISAALRIENSTVEARMRNQLARAYIETEQFTQAEHELTAAWTAATQAPSKQPEAVVLESMGVLLRERGQYAEAIERFQQSCDVNQDIGNQRGAALQHYHIGDILARCSREEAAIPVLSVALDMFAKLNDEMAHARTAIVLGAAYEATERLDAAYVALQSATAVMRLRSQPVKEAQALEVTIRLARRQHDRDLFTASVDRLLTIYQEAGSPRLEIVRKWTIESAGENH